MSEADLALAVLIFGAIMLCGAGALVLFLPMLDRLIDRWKAKHA